VRLCRLVQRLADPGFVTGAGGQARIDSTVGRGTTVTMLLPLAKAAASAWISGLRPRRRGVVVRWQLLHGHDDYLWLKLACRPDRVGGRRRLTVIGRTTFSVS
jgi:hypothetical protein